MRRAIFLILLFVFLSLPSFALANKYIQDNPTGGDCNLVGVWVPETKTCTLSGDVYDSIIIGNGLAVDGKNYSVTNIPRISYKTGISMGNNATIKNTTVTRFSVGINLRSGNTVENNEIINNNYNVNLVNKANNNIFKGNHISQGFYGIYSFDSHGNIFENNVFDQITSVNLNLQYSNNLIIRENTFFNGWNTVWLTYVNESQIYNNNFFSGDKEPFYIMESFNNVFDMGIPIGGNYWENYDKSSEGCIDVNNDGFCDTRFSVEGLYVRYNSYDNFPYIQPINQPEPQPQGPDPVIIIPGIAGTELYNGNDLIWLDLSQMFTDINDQFLTENLDLDINGDSSLSTIQPKNIIEEIKFTIPILNKEVKIADYFKSLMVDLENNNYKKDQSYFIFPYDWRLDLNETKDLLKQKIEEVKTQTGAQKVNIIAHSMGGLLVKDYLNSYGKNSVDKLIFVGTPHLGAPKAAKTLLEGDRFGIPWLEEDRIKDIAQNSPALHELLPNQTYFNEFQGYIRKYKLFGDNPLMNYGETKNFFLNDKNKNPLMFQKAENFYNQNLDDLDFSGIETYNIVGCKTPTQAAYSFGILNEIGQTGYTSGDGTVPMVSADYIDIPSPNKFYVKDGSHAELPSTNGVRNLILEILNNNVNNLESNVSNDSSSCGFKGKKLTWHSPVEIHIYDSFSNHTGPIENNAIEYGIPGIDYDVMGHNKFIFLPTDGGQEYQVEARGLENSSFDLSISEVENGQNLTTQVFNDVPVTTSTVANFSVNNLAENNTIELKEGDKTTEIAAGAVLEGDSTLDLIPPETQIILNGKEYKDKEFKKGTEVNFTSTDNDSGILGTWYSLDGQNFIKYTGTFTLKEKEMYKINYYSVDKAGNNEKIKQSEIIIGKLDKYLKK